MPRHYAPKIRGVDSKHIYEPCGRPQSMDLLRQQPAGGTEETVIATWRLSASPRATAASLGSLGPVSEASSRAWVGGIGILVGFGVWIAARDPLEAKEEGRGGSVSDTHPDRTGTSWCPSADRRRAPEHEWRPDVDPAKSARAYGHSR